MAFKIVDTVRVMIYVCNSSYIIDMQEVILMPKQRGLCPSENYTCVVNTAAEIAWHTVSTERWDLVQSLGGDTEEYVEAGGFQVTFIKNRAAKKLPLPCTLVI